MPVAETPPPGSPDAIEQGCWCPVWWKQPGGGVYTYNIKCPVHHPTKETE